MNCPVLEVKELSLRYGSAATPVLDEVSFALQASERVALLGLNGSGKTSLLSAIAGLLPCEGHIIVEGLPLNRENLIGIRQKIGFLFNIPEDQLLFPRVLEDVAFGLLSRGIPAHEAKQRSLVALDSLGIPHLAEAVVAELSHGQKQRVALAGALVTEPGLLLLDEPTAALDPKGKRQLAQLLKGNPAAMLLATHDLVFARDVCSRYLCIEQGRIALAGTDFIRAQEYWEHEDS
jgi:cobalt/nickel transport system ATP-binding protein